MNTNLLFAALLGFAGTAIAADEVTLQLVARDGKFFPANLSAPAGKTIRIEISNAGKTPIEFESLSLRKEKVLGPGAKSVVVIRSPSPGEYKFFDDYNPATSQGVLTVK
ncbi:cupredoxin domain-containing protein [Chitinimonas sp. BJB300]|uniref:cupredoxin domain-containing protein n=1 Tax=Chitinimonas sp. BJB300 TaxID=1559339 RepID=UPI000C0EB9E9|nr:cupredoxin domain-containing protein [Chitinimonas sp. BJB300]PHV10953.1 cupredoxin-domain containing protein [Chitinimonas sp. BJB300]TSJ89888.1 cupredoxin domain-containing protein [Chitinimonas sp. BJB300]